ncbi:hypothetical protein [Sorangium sp. So ce145]|uniref:hypothetical protein n=1 Tax=Sorangium sp. So ce145 TaxID=3133285 RepID=UPI003F5FF8D1
MAHKWDLAYALNNLGVVTPFESEFLAIVPASDPRVVELGQRSAASRALMSRFTDPYGRAKNACALIVRSDAPDSWRTRQAIVGFRDVFAISSLAYGCQMALTTTVGWNLIYTTYFDLYPIVPTDDGDDLMTITAAVRGFDPAADFRGQVSPYVMSTNLLRPQPDPMLVDRLRDEWIRHVQSKSKTREALFRSMEVAYQAASLPLANSAYEHGARVALWVSACEILANSASGRANLGTVLDLLGKAKWNDRKVGHRRYVVEYPRNNRRRVSFVGKLYRELYVARNDFLHGNPVQVDRLFPFKDKEKPFLNLLAPLVYKVAVMCYVDELRDKRRRDAKVKQDLADLWEQGTLEEAFLKVAEG